MPDKPVPLVEKGVLKSFLTTRQPVKGSQVRTGTRGCRDPTARAAAAISNLLVSATESTPLADLKKKLIDMVKERGKPYGMLVRKLDYPFSEAAIAGLRALLSGASGSSRPVSPPLLVYRVYPDGREELVRGLRFRGVSTRALRDVLGASKETALFDYVNNSYPLAMVGAGGYMAPTAVVAPGLLFDEIEFEHPQEQLPKPPLVPAPTGGAVRSQKFMRLISRIIFRELFVSSVLGASLFTFVLFLQRARTLFEFLVQLLGIAGLGRVPVRAGSAAGDSADHPAGRAGRNAAHAQPHVERRRDHRHARRRCSGMARGSADSGASDFWRCWWPARASAVAEALVDARILSRGKQLVARELTADIQPRVFEEQFPNMILYVNDIVPGPTSRLTRIFMADVTPPDERKPGASDRGDSPRITLASGALAVSDIVHNRILLRLQNGETYESDKDGNYHVSGSPIGDQALRGAEERRASFAARG